MRLPRLPPIPREIPYAVGALFTAYTVASILPDVPLLFGLPTEGWLLLGMAAIVVMAAGVIRGLRRELAELREKEDAGIQAFRARLEEGNTVGATIRRWPKIIAEGGTAPERHAMRKATETERAASYKQAAAEWNAACRATVAEYMPLRLPDFDRRIEYKAAAVASLPLSVSRLREEWEQRYERMVGFRDAGV